MHVAVDIVARSGSQPPPKLPRTLFYLVSARHYAAQVRDQGITQHKLGMKFSCIKDGSCFWMKSVLFLWIEIVCFMDEKSLFLWMKTVFLMDENCLFYG